MKQMFAKLITGGIFLYSGMIYAANELNLPPPVTRVASEIYDLHTKIVLICLGIFVVVFGFMFWSIYHHRKSKGHKAEQFHENTQIEILWTVIPFLILISMAWPATKTVLTFKDTSHPDLTIKVTGYQWKWGYDYLEGEGKNIRFLSNLSTPRDQIEGTAVKGENYLLEVDNPLVIPTGKKVRLLLTANDVIHAWWIPAFGVKQDAIPGFIRDSWIKVDKPGTYRGQCAELCGKDHGFMPIVVEAVEPEKYTKWVNEQQKKLLAQAEDVNKVYTLNELKTRGEKVYAAQCAVCHQATGLGQPPAFPGLVGSKITVGPKAAHIDMVMNGKPGTAMAPFKAALSDTDIAAVITYERNAWSNKTGDVIQPAEIKAARK